MLKTIMPRQKDMHMAKMSRVTAQVVPSDTSTVVDFDTEDFDIGNLANIATNRFVIQQDGIYMIKAFWRCPNFSNRRTLADLANKETWTETVVYKYDNAMDIIPEEVVFGESFLISKDGDTSNVYGENVIPLITGNELEMRIKHSAGSDRSTNTGVSNCPRMEVIQIN